MFQQLVKHIENAHSNFVTGLTFVPCHTETGQNITGMSGGAVISISVDNAVIHFDAKFNRKSLSSICNLLTRYVFIELHIGVGYFLFGPLCSLLLLSFVSHSFYVVTWAFKKNIITLAINHHNNHVIMAGGNAQ